jgi:hypothetical protein
MDDLVPARDEGGAPPLKAHVRTKKTVDLIV